MTAIMSPASYKSVVQPSLKAVVSIYTSKKVKTQEGGHFSFGPFQFDIPKNDTPMRQQALGSGVIVRKDGLVITNNHVISMADEIKVVLVDGRSFDAKVIVRDPDCDLAALRFVKTDKNASLFEGGFPTLKIGRGDALEVGDVVLAIGNNLGLQGTVTQGIISAVGRVLPQKKSVVSKITVPLIQTSASINPGSSGGALVSMSGELVGINTAILTPSRGNVGLAFAVPSNYITPVLSAVDNKKKDVVRPFLGCTLKKVSYPGKGILVHSVLKGGPAEKGGIKAEDVIIELQDTNITDSDRFLMMVALQNINSEILIKVKRGDDIIRCTVKVGVWEKGTEQFIVVSDDRNPLSGSTIAQMNPTINSKLNIDQDKTGVVIIQVAANSIAAGLFRGGDQIIMIDKKKVTTLKDVTSRLDKAVSSKTRTIVTIRVARGDAVIEFRLSVGGGPRSRL
ncbi:hypothetical protein AAMO2058_000820000 [Amorphochlora amoebiformis]